MYCENRGKGGYSTAVPRQKVYAQFEDADREEPSQLQGQQNEFSKESASKSSTPQNGHNQIVNQNKDIRTSVKAKGTKSRFMWSEDIEATPKPEQAGVQTDKDSDTLFVSR